MLLHGRLLQNPGARSEEGWIRLEGSIIAELGGGPPPRPADLGDADAVLCPGFTDAHVHLPQVDHCGFPRSDLLDWLQEIVFPAETAWADPECARAQIRRAHARMVEAGTLGYAAYLTSHRHAADALTEVHGELPLRAVAGTVLMERVAPAALCDPAPPPPPAHRDRLHFSVNPRFALACEPPLLERAARWGRDRIIQTHLSEQLAECAAVARRYPDALDYTDVYDSVGLLGPRTLLAHALHLNSREWDCIAERGATVVHCPGANLFLHSGLFDLAAARRAGVRVALGSDLAAGLDLAMPRVGRAMIEVATARRLTIDPEAIVPTPAEAWTIITETNAAAIGHDDGGRLAVGATADLLVLRPPFPADAHLVDRLLFTWRNDYIVERIVAGRRLDDAWRRTPGAFPAGFGKP